MDDRRAKAFDFASGTSRLLITLVTAFLAFTVTFSEKLGVISVGSSWGRWIFIGSWVAFVFSVVCGVWTQLALTQELEPDLETKSKNRDPSIHSRPVIVLFRLQIVSFLIATGFAVAFEVWRIYQSSPLNPQKSCEVKPIKPL